MVERLRVHKKIVLEERRNAEMRNAEARSVVRRHAESLRVQEVAMVAREERSETSAQQRELLRRSRWQEACERDEKMELEKTIVRLNAETRSAVRGHAESLSVQEVAMVAREERSKTSALQRELLQRDSFQPLCGEQTHGDAHHKTSFAISAG